MSKNKLAAVQSMTSIQTSTFNKRSDETMDFRAVEVLRSIADELPSVTNIFRCLDAAAKYFNKHPMFPLQPVILTTLLRVLVLAKAVYDATPEPYRRWSKIFHLLMREDGLRSGDVLGTATQLAYYSTLVNALSKMPRDECSAALESALHPSTLLIPAFIPPTQSPSTSSSSSSSSSSPSGRSLSTSNTPALTEVSIANVTMEQVLQVASNLTEFFMTHMCDPYSSVVGLELSIEFREAVSCISEEELTRCQKSLSNAKLAEFVNIDDAETLQRALRSHVLYLRAMPPVFSIGSIVVVPADGAIEGLAPDALRNIRATPALRHVFARVLRRSDNFLTLALDPTAERIVELPEQYALPLSEHVLTTFGILGGLCTTLERCVRSPIRMAHQLIIYETDHSFESYLKQQGFDEAFVALVNKNSLDLQDLTLLSSLRTLLESGPPTCLTSSITNIAKEALGNCEREMRFHRDAFVPAELERKNLLDSLMRDPCSHLQHRWGLLRRAAETCFTSLQKKKIPILDGHRKKEIVDWWLTLIQERVHNFIVPFGYVLSAIPDNYTDEPPSSLADVRRNLNILQKLIKSLNEDDRYNLKGLIQELQTVVYTVINDFVAEIGVILHEQLGASFAEPSDAAAALDRNTTLPPELRKQLDGCIKDLEYLSEMQRMENPDYKGSNFHIVPVSGLVLSELCRMENECNTVLELWVPSEYVRRDEEQQTALHQAVAKSNLTEVDRIITAGLCDVNSKDAKGWTPLHYGSVHQSGLACCRRLLDVKQIDVAHQNDSGNTALHYMAFWQVMDPSLRIDYERMLESLILLEPRIVSIQNAKGETPLHNACQYGALGTVELLLKHRSDPNLQTAKGLSAAHCAVLSRNSELVSVLIQHKARCDLKDVQGESPLYLALNLNLPQIADIIKTERLQLSLGDNFKRRALSVSVSPALSLNKRQRMDLIGNRHQFASPTSPRSPQPAAPPPTSGWVRAPFSQQRASTKPDFVRSATADLIRRRDAQASAPSTSPSPPPTETPLNGSEASARRLSIELPRTRASARPALGGESRPPAARARGNPMGRPASLTRPLAAAGAPVPRPPPLAGRGALPRGNEAPTPLQAQAVEDLKAQAAGPAGPPPRGRGGASSPPRGRGAVGSPPRGRGGATSPPQRPDAPASPRTASPAPRRGGARGGSGGSPPGGPVVVTTPKPQQTPPPVRAQQASLTRPLRTLPPPSQGTPAANDEAPPQ